MTFTKTKLVLIDKLCLLKKPSILKYINRSRILEERGKTDTGLKLFTSMQFKFYLNWDNSSNF